MNITQENTGDLTAVIKIELNQADYQEKVSKQLKDFQQKANVPGFRPGKVPFGMVQKMYGKGVKIDEINKVLSEALELHITENKIETLGSPLMSEEKNANIDWDNQDDFEFYFDIAIQPEVNIDLESIKVDKFNIKADDKLIDQFVLDIQKRHGHAHSHDEADEHDIIHADAVELDENMNEKENGIKSKVSFAVEKITDAKLKASIIGLKIGNPVDLNMMAAFGSEEEVAHILNLKNDDAALKSTYRISALEISHLHEAELNEELFKRVYPQDDITTIEDFRKRIAQEAEAYYEKESDQKLLGDVITKLIEETKVELPAEFLKRWLLESNRNKVTAEQIESDFGAYERSLKWQLIENKLITANSIHVEEAEVRAYIKEFVLGQYFPKSEDEEQDKRMDSIVDTIMKNEKEIKRIYDEMYDKKMISLFKEKVKTKAKDITFEDFVKLAQKN
ncbi:MAG: trigger factor [Bacteroidetes bacterium]|nr:trigger factor [Bacteroidota bacterium]